jgi:hypothetical protein
MVQTATNSPNLTDLGYRASNPSAVFLLVVDGKNRGYPALGEVSATLSIILEV